MPSYAVGEAWGMAGWGMAGWAYQGLIGLVTLERQNNVCRSLRRHSHSICPDPWPWRLELTTNLSRYGVPPSTGSTVRMAAALYLAQRERGRLGPLLAPQGLGSCSLGPGGSPLRDINRVQPRAQGIQIVFSEFLAEAGID